MKFKAVSFDAALFYEYILLYWYNIKNKIFLS